MSSFAGYKENKLRKLFNLYSDKKNWKNAFEAIVPTKKEADKLEKSILFFHGCEPTTKKINVPIRHKQGLVYLSSEVYLVKSRGYLCDD